MLWRTLLFASALTLIPGIGLTQNEEEPFELPLDDSSDDLETPGDTPVGQSILAEPANQESAGTTQTESPDSESAPPQNRVGRMPSLSGYTGLFHLQTADSTQPKTFTLGLFGEYFAASDVVREGDDDRRFIGRLSLSYTVTEYLEAYVSLLGQGNVNNLAQPNLIQSQGDLSLGVKTFGRFGEGFSGGLGITLAFLNGQNSVGFDFGATSANFRGLLSYSLQEATNTPLLVHANIGYFLDNSSNLFDFELQRIEQFAHQVSQFDLFHFGLGFEVPLAYVTPFAEWSFGLPLGGGELDCDEALVGCPWDVGPLSFPHTLTLGFKGTPVSGLALNLGVDIGLTTEEATGLPAQAPYNLIFGLAYHLDPHPTDARAPSADETLEFPGPTGWVLGEVVSDETSEPIAGAVVSYPQTDLTDQRADSTTGRFRSYEFPVDSLVNIEVSHPAFLTRAFTRTIPTGEDGIRIRLTPNPSFGLLSGRVVDASGSPLPATIYLSGPSDIQFEVDPLTSEYEEQVDVGRYVGTVVADGYVSERTTLEVAPGPREWTVTLQPLPEGNLAVLRGDRIDLSGERIAFIDNEDELEPSSLEILQQVADLLRQYPEISLRVVAHTDDMGTVELTEQQSQEVVDSLIELGIDPSRLRAESMGSDQPLFPNISRRNRIRNRRVEFLFVD